MTGLFKTLNVGADSLYAARQGVDTSGHNIANAHTEGFSRQRVNIHQRHPSEVRGVTIGNGVFVKNITRAHDKHLEMQLVEAQQKFGNAEARYEALSALEMIYSPELAAGVNDELANFFNSLQELSDFPEELSTRSNVREAAQNLVGAFKRVDNSLRHNRRDLNEQIRGVTASVSDRLERIADLNVEIGSMEVGAGSQANDLRDERERLVRELSKDINVRYYENDSGMITLRGPGDVMMVEGRFFSRVEVLENSDQDKGFSIIVADPEGAKTWDVTSRLQGGRLESLVDVRDRVISGLIEQNEEMAEVLVTNFNQIHKQGYGLGDFEESVGRDFFEVSDNRRDLVSSLKISDIIVENTDAIAAASSPRAPGDNVIVNQLASLRIDPLLEDGTANFSQFYSNYVGTFGLDVVRAEHLRDANGIVWADLNARRESVSGVSLDEEATNILKWQTAFTASSKLITTVDEMLETVLSLKR